MGAQNEPSKPRLRWGWVVILLALVAWNLWFLWPQREPEADIPYSQFVAQVRQGNVNSVRLVGSEITGTLAKPLPWPSPTAIPGVSNPAAQPTPAQTTFTEFRTTFPETVGDPQLMPLLNEKNIQITVTPPPSPWVSALLTNGLPALVLVGFMVYVGRKAMRSTDALGSRRAQAHAQTGQRSEVTFEDIAGADEAKTELQEVVDFLRFPAKYHELGARIPRGILLVGPPGTGKTLMARAVSGEAGVPFFHLSASEFVEMFVGVGASRVRDLFDQAKVAAPAIVFIDELDAVGRRRGTGIGNVNDEREQTLNQLLVEMDGFEDRHEVIVLAATNRPDVLDPALLRPGRFDREVTLGLPDRRGREGILRIHTTNLHLGPDVDLGVLARTTTGFSGADLANLCNEAALVAARRDEHAINMDHFEEALDKVLLGGVRPLLLDTHDRRVVAYHESGHALVAWFTPAADPVHKVTIMPRGRALGVTEQLPGEDHYNYSREYLMARLAVMMGGRAAEAVVIGDITTGAENDLVEATRLARRMVTRWAMGSLGPVALKADDEQPFLGYEMAQGRDYSEATAARIDDDVHSLLEERYDSVVRLLQDKRELLDRLADRLLHEETVDRNTLEEVLGTRAEYVTEASNERQSRELQGVGKLKCCA
jgi:cell division protease FtsH